MISGGVKRGVRVRRSKFGPIAKRLSTDSSTVDLFEPFTGWITSEGITQVQCIIKRKAGNGQVKGAVAIQFADVRTNNPGDWAQLDATFVGPSNNERNSLRLTVVGPSKAAFRLAVVYRLDSGSQLSEADFSLEGAYVVRGEVVATATLDITMDVANVWHSYAITDFIPTIFADKVKFLFVVTSVEGTGVESRGAYRTADTVAEVPTPWRVASSDWNPTYNSHSGAGEFNTAELALNTNATYYLAQYGYSARFTSGTSARLSVGIVLIHVVT